SYHVGTECGDPSGRSVATTAGLGRDRNSSSSSGTGTGGTRKAYEAATTGASSASCSSSCASRKSRTSRTESTTNVVTTIQTTPIQSDVDMPITLATGPAIAYPAGRNAIAPIQLYALTRASFSGSIACCSAVSQIT